VRRVRREREGVEKVGEGRSYSSLSWFGSNYLPFLKVRGIRSFRIEGRHMHYQIEGGG